MHAHRSALCFSLLLALGVAGTAAPAQRDPLQRDPAQRDPALTEVWDPVPPKIDPGDASRAPSDAIVLFDGTDLAAWSGPDGAAGWEVENGAFTVTPGAGDLATRRAFGDVQLHLEWRSPTVLTGEGQERGNSGVFLMGRYEVQVLDSYESLTYSNGQAGSIYKQHIPAVNATRAPGEWQAFDIVFTAPRFAPGGRLERPATMTVLHNGVLIHNHVTLLGPTVFIGEPAYEAHESKLPLTLQDHGNLVSFRNIWIRELQDAEESPQRGEEPPRALPHAAS